jgi:hypothetical protein
MKAVSAFVRIEPLRFQQKHLFEPEAENSSGFGDSRPIPLFFPQFFLYTAKALSGFGLSTRFRVAATQEPSATPDVFSSME